ncbi:hypothetical protein [Cupriavidus necator]|uniref:hypothetical protein n=1 Tax=Cupriavidus necator TaxID=106590 RepID=UPI0011D21F71|nr:hypothetical protein [Cupriavidus necator]MDX6008388.1 hypothetical protein [Cupriavidus necator]
MSIEIKYEKVYQGLTFDGMLGHIANTIILWNLGKDGDEWRGTQNDCQLVVSFLLRSYHRRMLATGKYGEIPSTRDGGEAFDGGKGYHLEHAIPIACIMWALFNHVTARKLPEAIAQVRKIVDETMKVAHVSEREHKDLSEILCLGHNMSIRSMYATQDENQPSRRP